MLKTVYLALGSNLGDRVKNLSRAVELLAGAGVSVERQSSLYETEPRDFTSQPWFVNQVIETRTHLFPRQLLSVIQRIETRLGRKRIIAKGPRTIDIDIVFFGNSVVETPELVIPHPRLSERRFVLEPLGELAPDIRHPLTRDTMRELLSRVSSQKVSKLKQTSSNLI